MKPITINVEQADLITSARDPKKVGLYFINVPTDQKIASRELQYGKRVKILTGEVFEIVKVELYFLLLNPPIPKLCLTVKKCDTLSTA